MKKKEGRKKERKKIISPFHLQAETATRKKINLKISRVRSRKRGQTNELLRKEQHLVGEGNSTRSNMDRRNIPNCGFEPF